MQPLSRSPGSLSRDLEQPLSPQVSIELGVARFVEMETRTWERAFAILGLPFNRNEFLREAGQSIDNTIRSAIFYGGGLGIEEARTYRIGAAHSEAIIHERLDLLRRYGTFEEKSRLKLVV